MKNSILAYWQKHPLRTILLLGLLIRMVSVVYSKGFGMVDDHFVVVKPAQELVDGVKWSWYRDHETTAMPSKRSVLYPGTVYLTFLALESVGITDPHTKMFFVRFWHALFNLLVPFFGFKIALRGSNLRVARTVGLMLALCWWMPVLSVRNLNEMVCMPLLLGGSWFAIRAKDDHQPWKWALLAGAMLGLAFSVRYQAALYGAGVGLALLIHGRIKMALTLAVGTAIPLFIVHGLIETYEFGYPFFGKVINYVQYNMFNPKKYGTAPWYNHLLFISGILIPPVTFMLWAGMMIKGYRHLTLLLPILIFLAFHSYFPNKQERFVLPVVPAIITLGWVGWSQLVEWWTWPKEHPRFIRGVMVWFWSLNILALLVVSPAYSKRSRVESLYYLHDRPNIDAIVMEESTRNGTYSPPFYYLGHHADYYQILNNQDHTVLAKKLADHPQLPWPDYLLLVNDKQVEERLAKVRETFPDLTYETLVRPSYLDRLLHWLNPRNKNENVRIYKIGETRGPAFDQVD